MTIDNLIRRLEEEYSGSAFTGHWASGSIRDMAVKFALDLLADAVNRTINEDMRTPDIIDALDYLERETGKAWPVAQFRRSLDMENPNARWQNANAALNGIRRQFGGR